MNKHELYQFIKEVDSVLWREWNPVGYDVPDDEYTSYALDVAAKVWNKQDKQIILNYLYDIENHHMGLSCKKEQADLRNSPIVDKVIRMAEEYRNRAFRNYISSE